MTPNLFSFATSELSQDAVLAWLLTWADTLHAEADVALHAAGRAFLICLLDAHGHALPAEVTAKVSAQTQVQRIDLLVRVDLSDGRRLLLPIEDKTDTGPHSDQLNRYLQIALAIAAEENRQVLPLYVKSGTVRDDHHVRSRGWEPIGRGAMLRALRGQPAATSNAILADYLAHLSQLEADTQAFYDMPCADRWPPTGRFWEGLFTELEDRLTPQTGRVGWDYVANAKGGFMGLWWGFQEVDGGRLYGQLEGTLLTVKVGVDHADRYRSLRQHWHGRVVSTAAEHGLVLRRPARFGFGKHMTVAEGGDWRVAGPGGSLNLDATTDRLVRVARLVKAIATDLSSAGA